MGSPFETSETQVAQGNGTNPFQEQLNGSGANGAPYYETSNPNGQWRATPYQNGTDVNIGPTTPIPGQETQTWPPQTYNPNQQYDPNAGVPTQTAGNREDPNRRTEQPTGLTPGSNGDLSGGGGGGGGGLLNSWMLDRGLNLGASVYALHRSGLEGTGAFLPTAGTSLRGLASEAYTAYKGAAAVEGATFGSKLSAAGQSLRANFGGTASTIGTSGKDFTSAAYKTELGKTLGGSFIATTALDMTLLSDRTTSWKTYAVDIGLPLAANFFLKKWASPLKVIGATAVAHAAEKWLFEDKKS